MLAIDSLFTRSFLGQLRSIGLMTTTPSRDEGSPPHRIEPTATPEQSQSKINTTSSPKSSITKQKSQKSPKHRSNNSKCRSPRAAGPRLRKGARITRPEPGSLYDIMHDNAGTSLYQMPICWSDRHAELLGVRFDRQPTIDKPIPILTGLGGKSLEPSHMARVLTQELSSLIQIDPSITRAFCKNRAIKHVMSTLFPNTLSKPKTSAELDLFFGLKAFRKAVRIPCVWKSAAARDASFDSMATTDASRPVELEYEADLPILAYINRSQLASIRRNLFRIAPGPGGRPNEVVARLQALRSKMLMPSNVDHDSYIVAILLAMAQAHFYRIPPPSRTEYSQRSTPGSSQGIRLNTPHFRDVKVQLITHDEGNPNDPHFFIYTATVTAAFLERFMYPHKAPVPPLYSDVGIGMKISYTPVKMWPILGLRERLAKALGPEISGISPFDDPEFIDLEGPLVEPEPERLPTLYTIPSPVNKLKRRRDTMKEREPLGEVLNSSFEEESTTSTPTSSDDRPVLSPNAAKRRRTASRSAGTLEVC
ncbi:hypothetical protein QBC35DRAFT_76761 [Podospora australis]|uniref:Uncharacterized protein n=1 Tax=Podospora australis TaxID=1536484 RepID=A0AAN6WPF2_9PEZI|nr:hypothetical protein QBC35DRAFT_76761 [Podospora australis]